MWQAGPNVDIYSNLYHFSLNFESHSWEILSQFPDSRSFYLSALKLPKGIESIFYISTCNRIELFIEINANHPSDNVEALLSAVHPTIADLLNANPSKLRGISVARYLIELAVGLKSLALGETQIMGQIKRDIEKARSLGLISNFFQQFLNKVFEVQKKIRTDTDISRHSTSLISLIEKEMQSKAKISYASRVILFGASEMSAKIARHILKRKTSQILLVRKQVDRDMNSEMRRLIDEHPNLFQIVTLPWLLETISPEESAGSVFLASSSTIPLIGKSEFETLKINHWISDETVWIDLALPANLADDFSRDHAAQIISLASLKILAASARERRQKAVQDAEPIIMKALTQFWLDSIYRKNSHIVQERISDLENKFRDEWATLTREANLTEKQKRILYDYMKKEQRRQLHSHREMILDLISLPASQ